MRYTSEVIEYGFKKDVRLSLRVRFLLAATSHDVVIILIVIPMLLAGWLDKKYDRYCAMIRKERSE